MYLTGNQVRQSFLDFFAQRGHTIVPSASLVPGGDSTLLFTNAAENGIWSLHAEVLPSNDAILKVLGDLAPIETLGVRDGVRQLCMPLGPSPCPQCAQDLGAA